MHQVRLIDGYQVYFDQVVTSGVPGMKQGSCPGRTLWWGGWEMGGMSFGIKNISEKFKYVMSEQADKFKSGHTQNTAVPPLRRILAVSGYIFW